MMQYFEDDLDLTRSLPAWGFNALAIGVSMLCLFAKKPNYIPIMACALMPWLALILGYVSKGWFRVLEWDKPKRPNLSCMIVIPSFMLFLCAFVEFHILDWPIALWAAVGVSAILTIAIGYVAWLQMDSKWLLLILWLMVLPYGYGVVTYANTWFDSSNLRHQNL